MAKSAFMVDAGVLVLLLDSAFVVPILLGLTSWELGVLE
ncbi:hypothetical protein PF008_g30766 [Phytophthora fragariae]|uniref:Uncharacterized protein n=1 Tax=Phytophthora fragariae TaxID=53985 RepID=A0A6G0Q4N2_9STRA|nr:hypothetical protein PF008_g30766 [Phytophthora fragariae]